MAHLALLVFVASSFWMTGVSWFLQLVHHPLYPLVGREGFAAYETAYNRRLGVPVFLPSILALLSAVVLLFARPMVVPLAAVIACVVLVLAVIAVTAALQAPLHVRLSRGFDEQAYLTLLRSQWVRTICWSVVGLLALWMSSN